MYRAYWGLSRIPFANDPDPDSWVELDARAATVVKLRHGLSVAGTALLEGPRGVGKTRLAHQLLHDFRDAGWRAVYLPGPGLVPGDIAEAVRRAGPGGDSLSDARVATRRFGSGRSEFGLLAELLEDLRASGRRVLLAVDETQDAQPEAAAMFASLANVVADGSNAVNFLYIGRDASATETTGSADALSCWRKRAGVVGRLAPLSPEDSRQYLLRRLKLAGMTRPILTRSAANRLAEHAGGRIADLHRLADLALMAGYGLGATKLTPDQVDMAATDLGLLSPSSPIPEEDDPILPPPFAAPDEVDVLANLSDAHVG